MIYFPVSSVKGIRNLICVSAQRVFFQLALFYIIFLQAARGEHAKGRGVPPLILFKGRGWLHTDHILVISHPFVPPPPPPLSQCYPTLQSDLNLAEEKQSAWVPQRVLARTVHLERSISPPYTQEFMAIQIL